MCARRLHLCNFRTIVKMSAWWAATLNHPRVILARRIKKSDRVQLLAYAPSPFPRELIPLQRTSLSVHWLSNKADTLFYIIKTWRFNRKQCGRRDEGCRTHLGERRVRWCFKSEWRKEEGGRRAFASNALTTFPLCQLCQLCQVGEGGSVVTLFTLSNIYRAPYITMS